MATDRLEEEGKLKALIDDLQERINGLKLFDRTSEVNAHCDDLICQVTLNFESAVNLLNKLQEEMIANINNYRDTLLDVDDAELDEVTRAAKKRKRTASDADTSDSEDELSKMIKKRESKTRVDMIDLDTELERLSTEIASFAQKCSSISPKTEDFDEAYELKSKVRKLRRQMRDKAFQGVFMRFNDIKTLPQDFPGKLDYSVIDTEYEKVTKHVVLDQCVSMASSKPGQSNNDRVETMIFLQDGNLAVSVSGLNIFIWSPTKQRKLFYLVVEEESTDFDASTERILQYGPTALVQLQSGHLVSSDLDRLHIWNLKTGKHLKMFYRTERSVLSLRVLPNGDLAAFDGEWIYIWSLSSKGTLHLTRNPPGYEAHASLIIKLFDDWSALTDCVGTSTDELDNASPCFFSQHLEEYYVSGKEKDEEFDLNLEVNFEVLSNGHLAVSFVSETQPDGVLVKIWEPKKGYVVREVFVPGSNIDHCKILPSGDVVLFLREGIIKLYDTEDKETYQSFPNEYGLILDIRENSDGSLLFIHLNDPKLRILKPDNEDDADHDDYANYTNSICISNDAKRFAVGSVFGRIVVWPLEAAE